MRETLDSLLGPLSSWLRPHIDDIALAIIATILVIYGNDLNKVLKRNVGKSHFLVRVGAFIAMCTFGYGLITVFLTDFLSQQLGRLSPAALPLAVIGAFVFLSYLAEKKNQV